MYVVTVESWATEERFKIDAKDIVLIEYPDPATNPPKGVYVVMLRDHGDERFWTYDLDLAKLGH